MGENITAKKNTAQFRQNNVETGLKKSAPLQALPPDLKIATEVLQPKTQTPLNDAFVINTKKPSLHPIKKHYFKLHNQCWKETGLPAELMPKIVFKDFSDTKIFFGYSFPKGHIGIPDSIENLEYVTKLGKDKFFMTHECRHAKQLFDIARLQGSEKLKQILLNNSKSDNEYDYIIKNFNKTFYDKVIKTMGTLDENSAEGRKAAKFAKALGKYKSIRKIIKEYEKATFLGKIKLFAKYKKTVWDYNHNHLELDANNTAKKFRPSVLKNELKALKVLSRRLLRS